VRRTRSCSVAIGNPRAACAQSFVRWQQATIEIMLAISLTITCSRYIYYGVILHAHPVRGESHNQRNNTGEVAAVEMASARFCFVTMSLLPTVC